MLERLPSDTHTNNPAETNSYCLIFYQPLQGKKEKGLFNWGKFFSSNSLEEQLFEGNQQTQKAKNQMKSESFIFFIHIAFLS